MNKGQRLYECDDCKTRRYISKIELSRAAKPRCLKCGCSRLEMCSPEAQKEMAEVTTAMKSQHEQFKQKKGR